MPSRSSLRPPPGQQDQGARLAAPATVGQVGGTRSRLYFDSGYGFVAALFSSACAFFGWDAYNFFSDIVKGSLAASVDGFIAHALFPAQAVCSFCREHVNDCCSFAWLVAIRVSAFVDGFGIGGGAGAYECGQCNSLQHFFAPYSHMGSVA